MLDDVKSYLKVEWEDEDVLLSSLITAADQYVQNAVGVIANDELYKLAIKFLVAHWFENREVVGKVNNMPHALDAVLTQLQYCRGVVDEPGQT
ncbi:head-tail connector protein [Aureibacillus halotolerans]|uniref:Putative phage protein (Predicted DNA packaging) n=1 Tax=Aureibacillus halotolerans TaxID=1508390 RepID=A0A4R6U3A0_9BACI|nr:head-tail connector protein [Aureibacillus halotolerans]TDQ39233.1 putative phage protein (predicted DNA packaging) [Aureibacillus halotolerans]